MKTPDAALYALLVALDGKDKAGVLAASTWLEHYARGKDFPDVAEVLDDWLRTEKPLDIKPAT